MKAIELFEYGRHAFPGIGRHIFSAMHYRYMARQLASVNDPNVKEFLIDWFSKRFFADNHKFKPNLFKTAIEHGDWGRDGSVKFEQRHFYYFAYFIKHETDSNVREYLTNWVAEHVGGTNSGFMRSLWNRECRADEEATSTE